MPGLETPLTEEANPASASIDALATEDVLRIINAEDRKVAEAVEREIPAIARAVDAIVEAFERGGRLFYIGAGTSGRLGVLDASECPPTFGVPPDMVQGIMAGGDAALSHAAETTEDDAAAGARDLLGRGFQSRDVLAALAASGRTPYVLGAIAEAARLGAVTIGVSCTPGSELARAVRIPITPAGWSRGGGRKHAPESRHCPEDGTQHALYRGVHPVGICLRQPDGECATGERQAGRPGAGHCGARGGRGRASARASCWPRPAMW